MSPRERLVGHRIGCVKYLNAEPLVYGCRDLCSFGHPSELVRGMDAGELDVGLVPVVAALRHPEYLVVDDVAIAGKGLVYSVFLASGCPVADVRRVYLDPASRTSTMLLRWLMRERQDVEFIEGPVPEVVGDGEGALLIGSQAIDYRQRMGDRMNYWDLGGAWTERTGLSFVFAVWLVRPGLADVAGLADALRQVKSNGVAHISEIAGDDAFRQEYLTRYIRYDLGESEKAGIEMFLKRCGDAKPAQLGFV